MLRLHLILTLACVHSASVLSDVSSVRLVNGGDHCSGRLEILHNDRWEGVCDMRWRYNDAKVVCRQLNCGRVVSTSGSYFGRGSGPLRLSNLGCTGSENNITQCPNYGSGSGQTCQLENDAVLICSGLSDVRLVNGRDVCSGRVEFKQFYQWGTVCDDDWDLKDAEVVCRQLGCGKAISATLGAHFGPGTDNIVIGGLQCSGNEKLLKRCLHKKDINCNHDDDAGVVCSGGSSVRLVNGSDPCSGRVEVYHKTQWGTVCEDDWDLKDAEVVCRQVGCGKAIGTLHSSQVGRGHFPVWLSKVQCSGNESDIIQCSHHGFGQQRCGLGKDAGVTCAASSACSHLSTGFHLVFLQLTVPFMMLH